jgi:predicted ATPase
LVAPDAEKAKNCFKRALAVARQQQAKSWKLRAATSMARLWRDQGKRDQAEGFHTLDLKEGKTLLDELAG